MSLVKNYNYMLSIGSIRPKIKEREREKKKKVGERQPWKRNESILVAHELY